MIKEYHPKLGHQVFFQGLDGVIRAYPCRGTRKITWEWFRFREDNQQSDYIRWNESVDSKAV